MVKWAVEICTVNGGTILLGTQKKAEAVCIARAVRHSGLGVRAGTNAFVPIIKPEQIASVHVRRH